MTVSHHGDAAHDHELDPRTGERVNESSKVGRHLRAGPLRGIPRGAASVRAVRSVSAAGSPRSGSDRCSAACAGAVPSAREARSRWCSSRFQDTRAGAPLPPLRAVGGGRCQCVSPPCDEQEGGLASGAIDDGSPRRHRIRRSRAEGAPAGGGIGSASPGHAGIVAGEVGAQDETLDEDQQASSVRT